MTIEKLKSQMEKELTGNILPFWMQHAVDHENGGFYGEISNDLIINKKADKGLVLNARILWTFSSAYRILKNDEYLKTATRAYDYIVKFFLDKKCGGAYWMLDYKGEPVTARKQIYGLAFLVYAFSEYHLATGNEESLKLAISMYKAIEKHSWDTRFGGYFEARTREWDEIEDLRLGPTDMNEKKSMNTHLHVLEAYTNLARAWGDAGLKAKLKQIIELTIEHIIDPETYNFKLFFNENWESKLDMISFGHDIEGSWLMVEAAQVLGDKPLLDAIEKLAVNMAERTYAGFDKDWGLFYEGQGSEIISFEKHWWPQAEAIVGYVNAYQISGNEKYLETAYKCWEFTKNHIIDSENGEWFHHIIDGKAAEDELKVSAWKCPYHNGRACLEIIHRRSI